MQSCHISDFFFLRVATAVWQSPLPLAVSDAGLQRERTITSTATTLPASTFFAALYSLALFHLTRQQLPDALYSNKNWRRATTRVRPRQLGQGKTRAPAAVRAQHEA